MMNTSNIRGRGGPIPKFTEYHIWKTLMSLDAKRAIGRKKISLILDIGEGSTRTILTMLEEEGYIAIEKSGVILTKKGVEFRNSIYMDVYPINSNSLTISECNCAVRIPHAVKHVTYGCEERDVAILAGATGATTLVYQSGYLMFPGSNYPVEDDLAKVLKDLFKLRNDDVVIIGTASTPSLAECGAITAAINLMGGLRLRKTLGDLISSRTTANELVSLAFAIHDLIGGLPVCAKSRDDLGIRIENGTVVDNAYTGEILELALKEGTTIRSIAPSGPYKGIRVIVTPIELEGNIIAVIGVVDIRGIPGSEQFLKFS